MTIICILSLLTFWFILIGAFLVNRLRKFFKENYEKHSYSIIKSIIIVSLSTGSIIGSQMIRSRHREDLVEIELESFQNDDWTFPVVYLCLAILGHYFPVGAQIYCIKVTIEGNWNELFQSELTQPDENVSVNSHMFEEFR